MQRKNAPETQFSLVNDTSAAPNVRETKCKYENVREIKCNGKFIVSGENFYSHEGGPGGVLHRSLPALADHKRSGNQMQI